MNIKCGRQFCAQCLHQIRTYNGVDQPFQCMFCLQTYKKNTFPEENQSLIKQLWDNCIKKYDIEHTRELITKDCTHEELITDIDCRRKHLSNLIRLYKRFCGQTQSGLSTEYFVDEFSKNIRYLQEKTSHSLEECKSIYQGLISESNHAKDIGLFYLSICERLQFEIAEAEYLSLFPQTNAKINEWMHHQGRADEFQPKLIDLFQLIEKDLMSQWINPYMNARTKIGVIGYTSTGKSSLINCLLGIQSLTDDNAAPVSNKRSTYFPLQFDREEPLIDPDDRKRKTFATFVDIQGSETTVADEDAYILEIHKADCDIYVLVYDRDLTDEQNKWIVYIEEILKRKCVLVRSKMDIEYLENFHELTGFNYSQIEHRHRHQYESKILERLHSKYALESHHVYLIACDYLPANEDAADLLREESFDYSILLDELSRLAFNPCSFRVHALANRVVTRAINTCFRRGYVLNVMKYKIAAGFASIIPFGDQLPRYLSRDSLRDAFGIDEHLRQYLSQFHLVIYNYKLQTSVFEKTVEIRELQSNSKIDTKWLGRTAGTALVVSSGFAEDILRVALPAATAASGAARVAFTVATVGIGVVISAGVSAWSAVDSGKHIFSYINRLCDDTIMVTNALTQEIIDRERVKFIENVDIQDFEIIS